MPPPDREPLALFDRDLIRARRRRFAADAPRFLIDYALDGLAEKLQDIKREFPEIYIIGETAGVRPWMHGAGLTGRLVLGGTSDAAEQGYPVPDFIVDEELLPLAPRRAECLVSLLGLHLVNDLPGALVQIERALKADGLFIGVMLGAGSLQELREAFLEAESEISGGAAARVAPFADIRDLGSLLQRAGFALPVVDTETLTVRYDHMLGLIQDLRHMGWANPLSERPRAFLPRSVLMRAGEIYGKRFSDPDGRVRATFTLTWITGWSPHESQQKPAPRGSANVSLAEVLGSPLADPED